MGIQNGVFVIDIHLHILPGVDDGPETMDQMLALAHALVQEGIHGAIATPHCNDEFPRLSAAEIQSRVYDVQRMLDRYAIPLRLFPGQEVLIKPGLVGDIQAGRIATLNSSRYLLLELWNSTWLPGIAKRVIAELRAAGIIPVLAHVERHLAIQQDHSRLSTLLQQGALAQVTASSLAGMQGKATRRCAEALLKKGLIHFLASDAHGLHIRPPGVTAGLQAATRLLGHERVYQMVEVWPMTVLHNKSFLGAPGL
jgi:protein-tyrosine phosphatase